MVSWFLTRIYQDNSMKQEYSFQQIVRGHLGFHMKKNELVRLPQFSSVQPLSRVRLFMTPWTAAQQASLSIANSQNLLKLMSIESVMPSNHLILCLPPLLLPSVFPSIRVFSNESVLHIRWPKYWNFSFSTTSEHTKSKL